MYEPTFELVSFDAMGPVDRARVIAALVEALVTVNRAYLRANPQTPLLYASGVRFLREPDGVDEWQDIPRTMALGSGDCEDLASWRIAELRERGEAARVLVLTFQERRPIGDVTEFHIMVERADGAREDPSRLLGMP